MSEFKLGSYYGIKPRQFVYTGIRFVKWKHGEWRFQIYRKKRIRFELCYYPAPVKPEKYLKELKRGKK